jgi:hypothetical protein
MGRTIQSPRVRSPLPRAALAIVVATAALAPAPARAQPADVAAIQAREARNADARTIAALERFRQALAERFGGDAKLAMLEITESEGEALVVKPGGALEHAILQGGTWIGTDGRRLRPWVPPAVAAAQAFPLSSVAPAGLRAWLDAWRRTPGHATDFVVEYAFGYDASLARVVVKATVGSMATGRLSEQVFDPGSGAKLDAPAPKR